MRVVALHGAREEDGAAAAKGADLYYEVGLHAPQQLVHRRRVCDGLLREDAKGADADASVDALADRDRTQAELEAEREL